MSGENKLLIAIGVITLVIILAGVFFFSKGNTKKDSVDPNFDPQVLLQNTTKTKGDPNAPVKIVEFGDIQCPACKQAQPLIEKILNDNSDKVYFVFRHYPLSTHKNSKIAAQAAEAAHAQGKFFEMVHAQYEKQVEWAEKPNPREDFRRYAMELGLNIDQFNKDMEQLNKPIEEDFALGNKAGVESTPTFFINGEKYPGVIQADQLQQFIDAAIQGQNQQATPEASQKQ